MWAVGTCLGEALIAQRELQGNPLTKAGREKESCSQQLSVITPTLSLSLECQGKVSGTLLLKLPETSRKVGGFRWASHVKGKSLETCR